jgi:hypothetical protein
MTPTSLQPWMFTLGGAVDWVMSVIGVMALMLVLFLVVVFIANGVAMQVMNPHVRPDALRDAPTSNLVERSTWRRFQAHVRPTRIARVASPRTRRGAPRARWSWLHVKHHGGPTLPAPP